MNPTAPYMPLLVVLVIAGGMALLISQISGILGPKPKLTQVKETPFECGSAPSPGSPRQRFAVKFYVVALLFIVFDVEAVFLYPWAVRFKELGWFGYIEMLVFAVTLVVALIYVWRKGALDWEA